MIDKDVMKMKKDYIDFRKKNVRAYGKKLSPKSDFVTDFSVEYITLKDLLKLIPVSKQTISRWESSGKFPAHKISGRHSLWVKKEVDDWVNSRV
jgi:excisionase family DNA binding protein